MSMIDESHTNSTRWVVDALVVAKYPQGDPLGMFFGYYSLLVYEIQAVYITLFLRNRDLLTFYCCFTHMLSEIMNYFLKHALKHPRPDHGAPGGGLFEGRYGMPSQHCHCFAYLVTMVLLLVFHYYKSYIGAIKKTLTLFVTSIGLTLQVYGRVYLKYHTLNQCLAGVAFGSVSAIVFYLIGIFLFLPHSDYLCSFRVLRFLAFKRDQVSQSLKHYDTFATNSKSAKGTRERISSPKPYSNQGHRKGD